MQSQSSTTARTVTLTLLLVLCTCACYTAGQTNNTVDDTSGSIVWGELAADKPYKTANFKIDDGGLGPYYALAVSFIDSSLPEELPVATVKDILDGKASIGDKWQDLAKDFVGYALSIVLGILFILIFPIVGLCFCCCRCCGNCGGKRIQKDDPKGNCKRTVFAVVLTVLSLFVITGAGCTFVSSDQFHTNLDGLNTSVSDTFDDLSTYIDNMHSQFVRLGDTNFQFLSQVLQNYVGDASTKLSADIIAAVNKLVNLDQPLDELKTLSDQSLVLVQQLSDKVTTLETQRDSTKTELQVLQPSCSPCLVVRIAFLTNMDTTNMKAEIDTFKDQVSTDVFTEMKTKLSTAINSEITKATSGINVGQQLDDIYNQQIKGMLDRLTSLKDDLNKDASDYQEQVDDYVSTVKPFDKYRWYAGLGLACLLLLISVMMLVGVALGCFCGSANARPTQRGAASNCGGICLMSAVGLIFIFGALLMLLTTLMYMFGALVERYGCQSIDHLERIEKYSSSINFGTDLKNVSFSLNGDPITTSISKLMNGCEDGETLYTVLNLKPVVDKALKKIEDYKADMDISNKVNFNAAATAANGAVDVSAATDKLNQTVTSIDTVKNTISSLKTGVQSEKNSAEGEKAGAGVYYDPMITTLTEMEATCDQLKTTSQTIVTRTNTLTATEIPAAQAKLNDAIVMTPVITNVTQGFVGKVFGFVDSYVGDIRTKLADNVGKCTPFYSITNAVFAEAFCRGIVDPLNGFWLALGWSVFFLLPALILSVKLAKYYRTMLYEDSYSTKPNPSAPPFAHVIEPTTTPNGKLSPLVPHNKVAPF